MYVQKYLCAQIFAVHCCCVRVFMVISCLLLLLMLVLSPSLSLSSTCCLILVVAVLGVIVVDVMLVLWKLFAECLSTGHPACVYFKLVCVHAGKRCCKKSYKVGSVVCRNGC